MPAALPSAEEVLRVFFSPGSRRVLEELQRAPKRLTALQRSLGISTGEAAHLLEQLEEGGLIERERDGGYVLCPTAELLMAWAPTLRTLVAHRGFFDEHPLAGIIPPELLSRIGELEAAELKRGASEVHGLRRAHLDATQRQLWMVQPDLPEALASEVARRLQAGVEVRLLLPEGRKLPSAVQSAAGARLQVRVLPEVRVACYIADGAASLMLPDRTGKVDQTAALTGTSPAVTGWLSLLFTRLWDAAKPV